MSRLCSPLLPRSGVPLLLLAVACQGESAEPTALASQEPSRETFAAQASAPPSMESPEAVEGTEEPEPEPQPTENPQLEPPNAEATPPPTAPQALVNLCRQSASDGCESLHIAHLSPDETTCTYLSLDNCPTYDRRGLQGVDLPFSWRLLSARVSVTSGGDNSPECLPGALIQAGRRAESVRGEVFWDEDLADPVPEQVELDLVVTVEPIGQPAFDSAVSTPAPLSTQTACAD